MTMMIGMAKHKRLFCYLISSLFLPFLLFHSVLGAEEKKEINPSSSTYILSLAFTNGLLTIEADNAPLGEVLRELFQKTGTEFILRAPSLSTNLLSVSFRDLTVREAIERLLRNYSYVLEYGGSNHYTSVTILASDKLFSGVRTGAGQRLNTNENIKQTVDRPQSLDECQKLDFTEDNAATNKVYLYQDPTNAYIYNRQMREADRMALEEAKIKRAEKVLSMERCSHLWEQAINELTYIQDEHVTTLLADIAKNGKTVALKTKATQALWRHTAKSEFKDAQAINVLKGLATSLDEGVSVYAQQALQDYERYISRTKSDMKN
jgi:hypothetical protein